VLSVTFAIAKANSSDMNQLLSPDQAAELPAWPLEVMAFDGELYR
jgi:hypothetical protein